MGFSTRTLGLVVVAATVAATSAYAGAISYPNAGSPAPSSVITASATGALVAYFYASDAAHTDILAVTDVTAGWTSPWFFSNHSTAVGDTFEIGHVAAGDVIEFLLWDKSTGVTYSSNPANSPDGIAHFFSTPHTTAGPVGVPVGTYVGGEDLWKGRSDLDYNDIQFVFAVTHAPEPASLALVGLGLVAVGLIRRVRSKR